MVVCIRGCRDNGYSLDAIHSASKARRLFRTCPGTFSFAGHLAIGSHDEECQNLCKFHLTVHVIATTDPSTPERALVADASYVKESALGGDDINTSTKTLCSSLLKNISENGREHLKYRQGQYILQMMRASYIDSTYSTTYSN